MEAIDQHRNKFDTKVREYQEQKGKNSRMLTKEHYIATVSRLKQLEKPGEQRTITDNNLMRRLHCYVVSGFKLYSISKELNVAQGYQQGAVHVNVW